MNNSKQHEQLVRDIFSAVAKNDILRKNIRIWQRVVGAGRAYRSEAFVRFGIVGEADIQGIVAPTGRSLAMECKTGAADLSKDQVIWRTMFEKHGGAYLKARNVEQVTQWLLTIVSEEQCKR